MSLHLTGLIQGLSDADLNEKIHGFLHATDETMLAALVAEARRRGWRGY